MLRLRWLGLLNGFLCVLLLGACKREETTPTPPAAAPAPAPPPPSRLFTAERPCMGTKCSFKIWHHDGATVDRASERAFAQLDRVERLMSDWIPESELSRINQAAGSAAVAVSPDTLTVIKEGLALGALTEGRFDITVGAFRGLWKFDEDKDGSLPAPAEVEKRLALVDYRDVQVDEAARTVKLARAGQKITLGGIAKGYAVDAAVKALREGGINDFIVQAGGDLYAGGQRGDREWVVGVQNPRSNRGEIIYKLSLHDQAFNTSGDYERFVIKDGKRYHHILDARTGFPSMATRSVTLLAKSAFKADLLDTALFTMGAAAAMKVVEQDPDVEAVIVDADNRVHISSGLQGKIIKVADPTPGL